MKLKDICDTTLLSRYTSRKFLLSVAIFLITVIFGFMKIMDGADIAIVFSVLGGGYSISNVVNKKFIN
jgi:hypothetical protein